MSRFSLDNTLDENLRPVKVAGKKSALEISKTDVKVQNLSSSDINVSNSVSSDSIETNTLTTAEQINLAPTKKIYLDGGVDTYICETSDDRLGIFVGGDTILDLRENGASGNVVAMSNCTIGWSQFEVTGTGSQEVKFSDYGNKAQFTFGAGNVVNLRFHFPNVSCNCVVVIKQDGTGSRIVSGAWASYDQDGGNSDDIKWAGGSAPTLSTGANAIDIISFYWDNDTHTCYGVASLNFS